MDNSHNTQVQNYIQDLPRELQEFFLFDGFDFNMLRNANGVNHLWHNLIENLSRQLVDRYFPYFKITQPEARKNNPLKLLVNECKRYEKKHPQINIQLMLAALSGNRDAIEVEENQEIKKQAHSLFFANGHSCPLQYDDDETAISQIKGGALNIAAETGYLFAIHQLLNDTEIDEMPNVYKTCAMMTAAKKGQLPVLIALFEAIGDCLSIAIALILAEAATGGHLNTLDYLLNKTSPDIIKSYQQTLFNNASENGHFHVVDYLLQKLEYDKGLLLYLAAEKEDLSLLKHLLNTAGIDVMERFMSLLEKHNNIEVINIINEWRLNSTPVFIPNYQATTTSTNNNIINTMPDEKQEYKPGQ